MVVDLLATGGTSLGVAGMPGGSGGRLLATCHPGVTVSAVDSVVSLGT